MPAMTKTKFSEDLASENIVAKILVLATGKDVVESDAQMVFDMHKSSNSWHTVAQLVDNYMGNRLATVHGGNLPIAVSEVLANATGKLLSDTEVNALIADYTMNKGIDTWAKLFEQLIVDSKDSIQTSLDSHVLTKLSGLGISAPVVTPPVVTPPVVTPPVGEGPINTFPPNPASGLVSPEALATFVNPNAVKVNVISDWEYRMFAERGLTVADGTRKTFLFDAPLVKKGTTKGGELRDIDMPYTIFDFSNGDKTLAITEEDYAKGIFAGKNHIYLSNFEAGDKIVILDTKNEINNKSKYDEISSAEIIFDNSILPASQYSVGPGSKAPINTQKHLVDNDTFKYPDLFLHVFAFGNALAPLDIAIWPDSGTIKGAHYSLYLTNFFSYMPDGEITIVGANPYPLDSTNFILNSPEYTF